MISDYRAELEQKLTYASAPERTTFAQTEVVDMLLDLWNSLTEEPALEPV